MPNVFDEISWETRSSSNAFDELSWESSNAFDELSWDESAKEQLTSEAFRGPSELEQRMALGLPEPIPSSPTVEMPNLQTTRPSIWRGIKNLTGESMGALAETSRQAANDIIALSPSMRMMIAAEGGAQPEPTNLYSSLKGEPSPTDIDLAELARTNPNLATAGYIGQGVAGMAPLAIVGGWPSLAQRLLAAGFSADMVINAKKLFNDYAEESNKPESEQDPEKLAQLKAGVINTFALAPLAGGAAARYGMKVSDLFAGPKIEPKMGSPVVYRPPGAGPPTYPMAGGGKIAAPAKPPPKPPTVVPPLIANPQEPIGDRRTIQMLEKSAKGEPLSADEVVTAGDKLHVENLNYKQNSDGSWIQQPLLTPPPGVVIPERPPKTPTPEGGSTIAKDIGLKFEGEWPDGYWGFSPIAKEGVPRVGTFYVKAGSSPKEVEAAFKAQKEKFAKAEATKEVIPQPQPLEIVPERVRREPRLFRDMPDEEIYNALQNFRGQYKPGAPVSSIITKMREELAWREGLPEGTLWGNFGFLKEGEPPTSPEPTAPKQPEPTPGSEPTPPEPKPEAKPESRALDMLAAKHDLTGQQSEMVLAAFKSLPVDANPEALQKAYLKLALPSDMPAEVGLGKVAGIKGAREVLADLNVELPKAATKPEAKPAETTPSTTFDNLIKEHGLEHKWISNPDKFFIPGLEKQTSGLGSMGLAAKREAHKQLKIARRNAAREIGVDPSDMESIQGRANALPKLQVFLKKQTEKTETTSDIGFQEAIQKPRPESQPEAVSELVIGTKFKYKGEDFEVTDITPEGEVTVKDGRKFGVKQLQGDETFQIDKGTKELPKPYVGGEFGFANETFNLAGEQGKFVEPTRETTGFGGETLTQRDLFAIQDLTKEVDPFKSANAAERMYGKDAISKIQNQIRVMDIDPEVRKSFTKEQRGRLAEVLNVLRQRGLGKEPPKQAPGIISGTALEEWSNKILREGRTLSGLDPELLTAYAIKGAVILERGIRDFAKWSGEMLKEYGDEIKPYLRRIYNKSSNVFFTPGRYAVENGKLKIVSEQEARRMAKSVKLNKDVSRVKEQLDLFDREIGEALMEGGRFLPKEMRPDVAKGAPAEKRTVTNREINQYFVNQLVTVRKAMQRLRREMAVNADPISMQFYDVLQKRFELSFRQIQELRRTSHEALYFWNRIRAEYQDIARMAGEMPEIKRKKPILDQLWKDLREKEAGRAGRDVVDFLRVNLFTPFSWTLDFTTNLMAVAGHVPAWVGMDMAHLLTGKPMTRTATALRALRLSGKNIIPTAERFRLPEDIETALGTTAGGEFQGFGKEVMVDFSEILKNNPQLAGKLKNLDYILGGPVRMKRAIDNFFGRFGAAAELYNSAYQAGRGKRLKGDALKQYVEEFVANPPDNAITDAVRVGGEFKFNRELPQWAESFASNIITKLAVEAYPRWTLQFSKWAGEMLGIDPAFLRRAVRGNVTAEQFAAYLAKAATGWGAVYAFNQLFYNQIDPNTMEYVNEKGERVRLSGRQPFPELYMLNALLRGDLTNAKAAFPYTSIPFAGMTGGQGGLLSPFIQTMIASWKGQYTAEQTGRELTKILNNAIPGKSMLGLIRSIYDPAIREGFGAPIPGVAELLPAKINVTTGEPMAPKQRVPGTGILLPTVGGTPFPGAVRQSNPIERVLLNHAIANIRPRRTSLIELPPSEVPENLRREYEQRVGQNVKEIIGNAIASPEWKSLSGKENFELRRSLLMGWLSLSRSMARAELAEKYNKSMGAEKPESLTVRRLPDFIKAFPQ